MNGKGIVQKAFRTYAAGSKFPLPRPCSFNGPDPGAGISQGRKAPYSASNEGSGPLICTSLDYATIARHCFLKLLKNRGF